MALYHRKFLLDEPGKKYDSSCYICFVCPEECYHTPPPPPPLSQTPESKNHQMSIILILLLCVLGAVFLFLSYLTIGKYRSRRRNPEPLETGNFADENHGPVLDHPIWYIRMIGLPQSTIDSISMFKYKKGEGLIEGSDCSVCLSEFQENESLRLLPKCNHAFHVPCIDTWLRSHKNCPVCRAPILIISLNNVGSSLVGTSSNSSVLTEENRARNELETRRGDVQTDETKTENQLADILSKSGFNFDSKNKKLRVHSDLADRRVKLDQELEQPVRRSVSMDFSSASTIFCTEKDEGCSDTIVEVVENQNSEKIAKRGRKNSMIYSMIKSSSFGRSLEKRPVSMKRSFSFSGKRSLRKNSRSLDAISIPELGIQNRSR